MRIRQTISIVILMTVVLTSDPVAADSLRLVNGDLITGKVVRMENQKIVFQTEYAGEIFVDWDKILNMITEEPIKVILGDGTTMEGFSRDAVPKRMRLETQKLAQPVEFQLAEVDIINPVRKPLVKMKLRTNVGINQERGNSDTDSAHLDGEFSARTEKNRFIFGGELNKEKDKGDTTSENWNAHGNYSHFLTEKWFLYMSTLFEHDDFADLELRSTLGGGAGYQFFESETLNLYVGAGPGYVNENFIEAEDKDFGVGQWVISYDQYFFDKFFQLFHSQNGYVKTTEFSSWLINTRQGVRFPIYKGFTTTFQYNYDYNNKPSSEADKKWDSKLMVLLGWTFEN